MKKDKYTFKDLVKIMKILRSENGCPWDREQTHESLKKYLIEEAYEVVEAIDKKNMDMLCEELGDLLLQVVFHARIAEEDGKFNIYDVITGICKKMYSRHSHVFGKDKAETPDEVMEKWKINKKKEKTVDSYTDAMKSISKNLPALLRSFEVQKKASEVGFDWKNAEEIFQKIYEELEELDKARKDNNIEKISEELGDLLFSVVNLCRFYEIHPELALNSVIEKFIKRFEYMEKMAEKNSKKLEELTLSEMDSYWNQSKTHNL